MVWKCLEVIWSVGCWIGRFVGLKTHFFWSFVRTKVGVRRDECQESAHKFLEARPELWESSSGRSLGTFRTKVVLVRTKVSGIPGWVSGSSSGTFVELVRTKFAGSVGFFLGIRVFEGESGSFMPRTLIPTFRSFWGGFRLPFVSILP